ncbi:MAG: gliding motility lipoprotein GldD [Candidatus Azobacteroides sp.]|nr:gliding motility lipoprotein GldD [Candidatus Azobacteroides sp.]
MKRLFVVMGVTVFLCACNNEEYTPKPKGYFRIELQKKDYVPVTSDDYPFTFEIPSVSYTIEVSKNNKDTKSDWLDIYYPFYKARIYCTYTPVNRHNFREAAEDSYRFVYRHTVKADAIEENPFAYPQKRIYGILYTLSGNTASPVQFTVTDSTKHFFRGALYFDGCTPNQDSLKPVINYISDDIAHIISTFRWK